MKKSFLLLAVVSCVFCSCTTLANRRDMYNPQKVEGPYTRMLKKGIPKPTSHEGTAPASDGKSVVL